MQELNVTIHGSTLVSPSQKRERRSMFLSNIDQVLNFNVETVHFFSSNPDFPPQLVTQKLKTALCKVLVHYDFLAGRLKLNDKLRPRFEIDCNGAGVEFVVASTECSLDELGDLVYPNPAFQQLVQSLNNSERADPPLCIVQVTSFKCGGFVMGLSTNHAAFDGLSFKLFLKNLASQAFDDKPLAVTPCNDRHLLAARSPPRFEFPHPELLKLKLPIGKEESSSPPVFDFPQEQLDFRVFNLSSNHINHLKEKARSGGATTITDFNVVTAHIWRCKALSCDMTQESSTVLFEVDIRPIMVPPLEYTGNAVLIACATVKCSELERKHFSKLVDMVSQGAEKMKKEKYARSAIDWVEVYARSPIDWGELYKGFPDRDLLIFSWWGLGFSEVEYPWGKPKYSCPVVYPKKNIVLLFPNIGEDSGNGVNVLVALPAREMMAFQAKFHEQLA